MKAVLYCRVSTKEQVDNTSLESQERICREWCAKNGIEVVKVFVEEGESAKSADRTEFQAMLKFCHKQKGALQYVLVYKMNRFARNSEDHHIYKGLFAKLGISLRSATEAVDNTPIGKLTENMLSAFSQFDNDQRAENTVVGMKAALRQGRWPFSAPLGYLNVRDEGQPTLVHDKNRAPLVREAFELFATGQYTKAEVLARVTASGLRTTSGKKVSAQTFDALLRKPVLAGWMVVPDWGMREKGAFEPLVSEELFNRVQDVLDGKRLSVTPHIKNSPDFPLRVFIRCAVCETPITGSWSRGRKKKYPYYRCRNRQCAGVNVRKDELERGFLGLLERLAPKPEFLSLFTEIVSDVWRQKQGDVVETARKLQQRLAELKERKQRLLDMLLDQRIKQADYEERNDSLSLEIANLESLIHDARLEELDIEEVLEFAQHVLGNAAHLWLESSIDQRQRLQKVLFPTGLAYHPENGFGTAVTGSMFNVLTDFSGEKTRLASPAGFEPALPP
jgi:site-specific DNA recombinase